MISIKSLLLEYGASLEKTFAHNRLTTVGASEVGQCARKTWFSKHAEPHDGDYDDRWGARLRGDLIEEHFWVKALRAKLPDTMRLLYAGGEQRTLVSGNLSATTDGLLISSNPEICVNLDCKSIDPRVDLQKEKSEHSFQAQVQMGLIRECTPYQPEISLYTYINASFFDDIKEFDVPWRPKVFEAARRRADEIMGAKTALSLPPEGKMAGGDECKYCPWASNCADVSVAGIPSKTDAVMLSDNLAGELRELRDTERALAEAAGHWDKKHAECVDEIKQFLREHNARGYVGEGWSVSYLTVSGRATLDIKAVEAAGIDLSPYYRTGKPGDRLTVK